jgi:hypothetical protein
MANAGRHLNRRWRSALCGTVICAAWSAPCLASASLAELLACRDLADGAARLACFDREAAALAPGPKADSTSTPPAATSPGAATPTPPSAGADRSAPLTPPTPVPSRPAPVLDREQQFGLPERAVAAKEVAAGTRAADAAKIESRIARVAPGADGHVVFTLDNAQVWRQVVAEGDLLSKAGDEVTISRAWLGSYWLQLKSGRGCKVARLR